MSCDLRRLRLNGLTPAHDAGAWVARVTGSHVYILTSYGRRVAYLMTKLHSRIFNLAGLALATAANPSRSASSISED
jgi:hypothetical protein